MNAFWAEIPIRVTRNLVAISCAAILVPGDLSSLARPMLRKRPQPRKKRSVYRQTARFSGGSNRALS